MTLKSVFNLKKKRCLDMFIIYYYYYYSLKVTVFLNHILNSNSCHHELHHFLIFIFINYCDWDIVSISTTNGDKVKLKTYEMVKKNSADIIQLEK